MAGLQAEGYTEIDNIHFVERGYEDFHLKLREVGAQIDIVSSDRELKKFRLKYA